MSSESFTMCRDAIPLFLYGTLRPGGRNYMLLADYVIETTPARVWGELRHLPAGYPGMNVPEAKILARGTARPEDDADRCHTTEIPDCGPAAGDWGWVLGDIVLLKNPRHVMPLLDHYEGFQPASKKESLYERVLVGLLTDKGPTVAWTYIKAQATGDIPIASGHWNSEEFSAAPRSS